MQLLHILFRQRPERFTPVWSFPDLVSDAASGQDKCWSHFIGAPLVKSGLRLPPPVGATVNGVNGRGFSYQMDGLSRVSHIRQTRLSTTPQSHSYVTDTSVPSLVWQRPSRQTPAAVPRPSTASTTAAKNPRKSAILNQSTESTAVSPHKNAPKSPIQSNPAADPGGRYLS